MSCVLQGAEGWWRPLCQPQKATPGGITSNWGDLSSGAELCWAFSPGRETGYSSNCKVKLTPAVIMSLCVLSPFMGSLILLLEWRHDHVSHSEAFCCSFTGLFFLPLYTCRFIHHCCLSGFPAALKKKIKTEGEGTRTLAQWLWLIWWAENSPLSFIFKG